MSDDGGYAKDTFLSRVFGLQSSYKISDSNPLLTDDNDLSIYENDNDNLNFLNDFSNSDHQSNQNRNSQYSNSKHSNNSNNKGNNNNNNNNNNSNNNSINNSNSNTNNTNNSNTNTKRQNLNSINIHSENESSSEEESDLDIKNNTSHPTSNYNNNHNNHNTQRHDNQNDYLDEMSNIPDSLLMENGLLSGNASRPINNINNREQNQNINLNARNSRNKNFNSDTNPFIQQLIDTERSVTPTLTKLGNRAKQLANSTFSNFPNSIPKSMYFQLPNTTNNNQTHTKKYDDEFEDLNSSSFIEMNNINNQNRITHNKIKNNEEVKNYEERNLRNKIGILSPREKSLWLWSNITNLDNFLNEVYAYYIGNGFNCIVLKSIYDLLIIIFIVCLTGFMGNCIDYNSLMTKKVTHFSEIKIDQCYSKISNIQFSLYLCLGFLLILRMKNLYFHVKNLKDIQNFYKYLLNINDNELQTISWPLIVKKIMILKDSNTNAIISRNQNLKGFNDLNSKTKLNAHDIANRLMRKENYMVAIFNKNILNDDLSLPLFFMGGKHNFFLTKTLEWNLKLCIFDFIFNDQGQIKPDVLNIHKRFQLSNELKKRLKFAGIFSIILSPFLIIYFLLYYFLKFFYDFKTNPALISSREYSPYARWKLREFNELPHIFDKRLKLSNESALNYISQFPKEVTNLSMKFISFISGSLVAILVILTILDPENFLNFEITEGRTTLFYISTLGAIFTICKNSINEDENTVFEPEASLRYVAQFTHYLPIEWEGKYHTEEVKNEFCSLYNLRIVLILKEILSLVFLPYILYFRLPNNSSKIIDFFREFSVHVDGLGYICTFAMFNFENNKDKPTNMFIPESSSTKYTTTTNKKVNNSDTNTTTTNNNNGMKNSDTDLSKDYYTSNDDKMIKSYLYFLESYGDEPLRTNKNFMSKSKSFKYNNNSNNQMQSPSHRAPGIGTHRKPQYGSPTSLKKDIDADRQSNDRGNKAIVSNDYYENFSSLNDSQLLGESFQAGYPQRDMIINDFESGVSNNRGAKNKSGSLQNDNLTLRKKAVGKSPLSNNGLQIHSEEEDEDEDDDDEDEEEENVEGDHIYQSGNVSYEQGVVNGNQNRNHKTPSNHLNVNSQYLYDDDDDDDDDDDSDDEDDDNQYNMVRGISSNNGYNNYYDGDHNNSTTNTRQSILRNPQDGKNRIHSNGRGGENQQGVLGLIKKIYKEQDLSPPRVTVANPTTAATTTTADTNH
ncbi:hypothetical protein B5S30_g2054 [[Candida] boidinii]|nr:hypothetical protein B5S30_g2054 [[Candida] boidinii]